MAQRRGSEQSHRLSMIRRPLLLLLVAAAGVLLVPRAEALNDGLGTPPAEVDRSSPLATVQGFQTTSHKGNYALAAHYLDLDGIPKEDQPKEGPRLARRLRYVLDRKLFLDLGAISKDAEGDPARPGYDTLGTIALEKQNVPIRVSRFRVSGEPVWVFSPFTVKSIDQLYEAYGPPLAEVLPEFLFSHSVDGLELWQWLGLILSLAAAIVLGWLLEKVLLTLLGRLAALTRITWDDKLVQSARGPLRLPLWALVASLATPPLLLPPNWAHGISVLSRSLLVVSAAWFALRFLDLISGVLLSRVARAGDAPDHIANARSVRTQLALLRQVMVVVVWILAAAALLMQFTVVRTVGVSLLASAGVAGVVIGLAAQKSIGALLAGIQLSVTQPIRIGDAVVVEGESGTVEEISLTYVVVRIWDMRRLIIPTTQFLEKPFQNWSKGGSEMLGAVLLQLDWTTDLEAVRKELDRVLQTEGKGLWDGKLAKVQVVETTERTMQVRVLVGGYADSVFDLRCLVRERLLAFARNTPAWLPHERVIPTSPTPEDPRAPVDGRGAPAEAPRVTDSPRDRG
jgi:small-conductance mechanosensitive channel